jgi:hypothetical protein
VHRTASADFSGTQCGGGVLRGKGRISFSAWTKAARKKRQLIGFGEEQRGGAYRYRQSLALAVAPLHDRVADEDTEFRAAAGRRV